MFILIIKLVFPSCLTRLNNKIELVLNLFPLQQILYHISDMSLEI